MARDIPAGFKHHFFAVIYESGERLYRFDAPFHTREEADVCASAISGVAIIEWTRDRRPQFEMVWVREDMKDNKVLKRFN